MPIYLYYIIHYSMSAIILQMLKTCNISNFESFYYLIILLIVLIITIVLSTILTKKNITFKFKTRFTKELNKRITLTDQIEDLKNQNRKLKELTDEALQKSTIQKEEHKILLDEIKISQEEILEMYKNVKESEKQYRILAESSQDMIVLVDKDVKITYTNKAFQDNFKISNEINARTIASFLGGVSKKITG